MQSFTFYLKHFILSILSHVFLKIWISILSSKISIFLPLWGDFFTFYWGFDSFNESPLQWWTCNLDFFVSVSDWHCRTTCLLGRSQDLCHTWSCAVESATVWICEVVLPFGPSCVPLSISTHAFPPLLTLSTYKSMATATCSQAAGTVVPPSSSCHFSCPESFKVLQPWVFSSKIKGDYFLRTPVFYAPWCQTAF